MQTTQTKPAFRVVPTPERPEHPYEELKGGGGRPLVADDMYREWKAVQVVRPSEFMELVADAKMKKKLYVRSDKRFPDAKDHGFDTYWLTLCGAYLVHTDVGEPMGATTYFYVPMDASIQDIAHATGLSNLQQWRDACLPTRVLIKCSGCSYAGV